MTRAEREGLPNGHVRMRIELVIEGPVEDAAEKLAHVLLGVPPDTRLEAMAQLEERARQYRAQHEKRRTK